VVRIRCTRADLNKTRRELDEHAVLIMMQLFLLIITVTRCTSSSRETLYFVLSKNHDRFTFAFRCFGRNGCSLPHA
jgi:hypothetical protein